MGIQLSDWGENIVGKGEIAHYEQFLLFPQCFQKLSVVDASKWVSMELRINTPKPVNIYSEIIQDKQVNNFYKILIELHYFFRACSS